MTRLRPLSALALLAPLAGCSPVVLDPAGFVAKREALVLVLSAGIMALIIVPVLVLIALFAWRYRDSAKAKYWPDWDHSTGLELVIWAAPLAIIVALGALTWVGTHTLDPYRPLESLEAGRPVDPNVKPLDVQVVSLDWKWLFIYPEQNIATVNELVLPIDRPVHFHLTSSAVMNTFYVPAMAGMIYTMAGMKTDLHAVMNRQGRFEGRSGHYSGAGFSDMTFPVLAERPETFDRWVAMVQNGAKSGPLSTQRYLALREPSEDVPTMRFSRVAPKLFDRIVTMCVARGDDCMGHPERSDALPVPPANDRPETRGKPNGAFFKRPGEMGTSPHVTVPRAKPSGVEDKGDPSNRNMTSLDPVTLPGGATAPRLG